MRKTTPRSNRPSLKSFSTAASSVVIVSPKDAQTITEPVAKLIDAGIPVIVLDRAVIGDKYSCFIAADPKQIGAMAGKWLAGRLARQRKDRGDRGAGRFAARHKRFTTAFRGSIARPGLPLRLRASCVDPPKVDAGKLMTRGPRATSRTSTRCSPTTTRPRRPPIDAAKAAGREKGVLFVGVGGMPAEGRRLRVARHTRRHVSVSDRRGRGRRRRREDPSRRERAEEDRARNAERLSGQTCEQAEGMKKQ